MQNKILRKNKGDFFYYLEVLDNGKSVKFTKKKRAIRVNLDRTTTKTKRKVYIKTVDLTEDGLALFKANSGDFDYKIIMEMLEIMAQENLIKSV